MSQIDSHSYLSYVFLLTFLFLYIDEPGSVTVTCIACLVIKKWQAKNKSHRYIYCAINFAAIRYEEAGTWALKSPKLGDEKKSDKSNTFSSDNLSQLGKKKMHCLCPHLQKERGGKWISIQPFARVRNPR